MAKNDFERVQILSKELMRRDIQDNTPTTPPAASSPTHEAESPKPLTETPRGRVHSVSRVSSPSSVSKDKRLYVSEMSSPTEVHDTALKLTHSDGHEPDDSSKQSSESSRAERLSRSDLHDRSSSEDSSKKKKSKKKKRKSAKSSRVNAAFLAKLNGIGAQGGFGMSPRKSPEKKKDVTVAQPPVSVNKVWCFNFISLLHFRMHTRTCHRYFHIVL